MAGHECAGALQLVKKGYDKLLSGGASSPHCLPCQYLQKIFQISGCNKPPASAVHAAGRDWKLESASAFQNSPRVFDTLKRAGALDLRFSGF